MHATFKKQSILQAIIDKRFCIPQGEKEKWYVYLR